MNRVTNNFKNSNQNMLLGLMIQSVRLILLCTTAYTDVFSKKGRIAYFYKNTIRIGDHFNDSLRKNFEAVQNLTSM